MDIFGNGSQLSGDKSKRYTSDKEELDFSYSDSVTKSVARIEHKSAPRYFLVSKFLIGLFFALIIGKVFYLQIVKGGDNQKLAEGNRIRPRMIEASRGFITDKNGVWLARNRADFALSLYSSDLPKKKAEREAVLHSLADISGVAYDEIAQKASEKSNFFLDSVIIKDHISHDDALLLEEKTAGLPGIFIDLRSEREYAILPGIAHLLGYTGLVSDDDLKTNKSYSRSDRVGKTGLEKQYDQYLRGVHGLEQVEVDSKGNIVRVLTQDGNSEPQSGEDVSLYLDRDLQTKAADELKKGIENAKTVTGKEVTSGAVIVMDVNTGGILSMVSLPDYDNNLFSTGISTADYQNLLNDKNQPLFNRATQGAYPPGSIIKIVMATAGLSEGVINENTSFDTPAAIQIGDYSFPDWKDHGVTDVRRAIAESNNVFFYAIGGGYDKISGLGIDRIKKWWANFGLGEKTGIDLPGEDNGFLPDSEWKERVKKEPWYLGDTYHVSIGQGDLLVTPLQMVRATATIANGGTLLHPQLVKKVTSGNGEVTKEFGPQVEKTNFIDPYIIQIVQQGMRKTVAEGSARSLNDLPFMVAGKTGTAQFFGNQRTHAWFEAYAPYDKPQVAIIVLIDGGGGGNETAAPVAKEILKYYFSQR